MKKKKKRYKKLMNEEHNKGMKIQGEWTKKNETAK